MFHLQHRGAASTQYSYCRCLPGLLKRHSSTEYDVRFSVWQHAEIINTSPPMLWHCRLGITGSSTVKLPLQQYTEASFNTSAEYPRPYVSYLNISSEGWRFETACSCRCHDKPIRQCLCGDADAPKRIRNSTRFTKAAQISDEIYVISQYIFSIVYVYSAVTVYHYKGQQN